MMKQIYLKFKTFDKQKSVFNLNRLFAVSVEMIICRKTHPIKKIFFFLNTTWKTLRFFHDNLRIFVDNERK